MDIKLEYSKENKVWLVDCEQFGIHGIGSSIKTAFEDFLKQVEQQREHYNSLTSESSDEVKELRRLFKTLGNGAISGYKY